MAKNASQLILIDKLFAPLYYFFSYLFTWIKVPQKTENKLFIIKLFGVGSIVRMVSVLESAELRYDYELITLSNNELICEELGVKAQFINIKSISRALVDSIRILKVIWKAERAKVIDLERKSNLSGIFRLISSIGKNASSFSFDEKNTRRRNQRFVTLKDKPVLLALEEILECENNNKTIDKRIACTSKKIIININAGEYLLQRRYPISHFKTVIQQLHEKENSFEFVLTGLAKEAPYVKQLTNELTALNIPYVNKVGKLNLKELITLLQESHLLLTNDSGPLHLAHYYKVPTVAIWGPTSSKLVAYPDSKIMKNVSLNSPCSPCFIHPKSKVAAYCDGRIDCLQNLNPKQVTQAVLVLSKELKAS